MALHFLRILTLSAGLAALSSAFFGCGKPLVQITVENDPPTVHFTGDYMTIDDRIYFDHDLATIQDKSNSILDHIAQALNNHKEIEAVHIIGHTDTEGEVDHNQDLSERRAAAVLAALKDRNVAQSLTSEGKGETMPVCTEETEECHAKNRRVEFRVQRTE